MYDNLMQNFTPVNLCILVSSIAIGIWCFKKSFTGIFVRYRWAVVIMAFAFTYEVATEDASHLHMLPFALFLWAIYIVSEQILVGKREPKGIDPDTQAEIDKIRQKKKKKNSSVFDIKKPDEMEGENEANIDGAEGDDRGDDLEKKNTEE